MQRTSSFYPLPVMYPFLVDTRTLCVLMTLLMSKPAQLCSKGHTLLLIFVCNLLGPKPTKISQHFNVYSFHIFVQFYKKVFEVILA